MNKFDLCIDKCKINALISIQEAMCNIFYISNIIKVSIT